VAILLQGHIYVESLPSDDLQQRYIDRREDRGLAGTASNIDLEQRVAKTQADIRHQWMAISSRLVTWQNGERSEHIQANSASYPQRDGKWVPAKAQWRSAARE